MGIIFFGTPQFAVPSLQALISAGEKVDLVVSQPDKQKGRGRIMSAPPVKELALGHSIPVIQPVKMRDPELHAHLRSFRPEFVVVVAYGRILPPALLSIPESGCVNVHGSLLPRYRGAAPIQWAIMNGDDETGICTMLMDEGLDTGPVLLCESLRIANDDTAESLSAKLAELGARTLLRTIEGMRSGVVVPRAQSGEAVYAPPLKKEDGRIDWRCPAAAIARQVRGLYPWPSAFCFLGEARLKITKAHAEPGNADPGVVVRASVNTLQIGTGEGILVVEALQPDGKRVMTAAAFLAGRQVHEGLETLR
ncbi:MAG TPA: methionyl-tRNA formyltransferase [Dissulfurispiraceae bacterium]|nr:methionyl-tRNA formyltransferase [Dissulfurispiraceae bacterium]